MEVNHMVTVRHLATGELEANCRNNTPSQY